MIQSDSNFTESIDPWIEKPSKFSNQKPFLAKVFQVNADHIANLSTTISGDALYVELNDVVIIEDIIDDQWFLAKLDQSQGRILRKTCRILDDSIPVSLCQYLVDHNYYDLHVCFASFVAQDVGDLSVTRGDITVATNKVNEHWSQGQVCFDGQTDGWHSLSFSQQVGSFPLNHFWKIDENRVEEFCKDKIGSPRYQQAESQTFQRFVPTRPPFSPATLPITHSSSLSSGSSSLHSADYQHDKQQKPPARPHYMPRQIGKSVEEVDGQKSTNILSNRQQDKLRGWLNVVKKKTARLSTRITASLGLIVLTRDEEFERHFETFKQIEKTIRVFIKNLTTFVDHFENFLLALQNTSDHLTSFYRDRSYQRELEEIKKKNKALTCEHFHAFRRTVDRKVVAVASQLLQKFSGPHQLINKRSAKLLDYDNRTKEMESCRDPDKKVALRDQYVIAKELYDKINRQLIEELPTFNRLALDIFRECILVLLESRSSLVNSYTMQTANLLDTPLMMTYTASDVASSILMCCDTVNNQLRQNTDLNEIIEQSRKGSGQTSGHGTRINSANDDDDISRPHSAASQLSSEFDQMALAAREISSTPLSQVSESNQDNAGQLKFDELDGPSNEINDGNQNISSRDVKLTDELNNSGHESELTEKGASKERRKKKKFQIYVASWPFVATGPNQLSVTCNQPLKLVKGCDECGNPDWSLVQNKKGQLGYVPSTYIKKRE